MSNPPMKARGPENDSSIIIPVFMGVFIMSWCLGSGGPCPCPSAISGSSNGSKSVGPGVSLSSLGALFIRWLLLLPISEVETNVMAKDARIER